MRRWRSHRLLLRTHSLRTYPGERSCDSFCRKGNSTSYTLTTSTEQQENSTALMPQGRNRSSSSTASAPLQQPEKLAHLPKHRAIPPSPLAGPMIQRPRRKPIRIPMPWLTNASSKLPTTMSPPSANSSVNRSSSAIPLEDLSPSCWPIEGDGGHGGHFASGLPGHPPRCRSHNSRRPHRSSRTRSTLAKRCR